MAARSHPSSARGCLSSLTAKAPCAEMPTDKRIASLPMVQTRAPLSWEIQAPSRASSSNGSAPAWTGAAMAMTASRTSRRMMTGRRAADGNEPGYSTYRLDRQPGKRSHHRLDSRRLKRQEHEAPEAPDAWENRRRRGPGGGSHERPAQNSRRPRPRHRRQSQCSRGSRRAPPGADSNFATSMGMGSPAPERLSIPYRPDVRAGRRLLQCGSPHGGARTHERRHAENHPFVLAQPRTGPAGLRGRRGPVCLAAAAAHDDARHRAAHG
ncbi:MAG: hypothetical protein MZV63_16765 [Marinilabiliales bacterium]|nr:hypothetical protein [Marinilabiliales bacterium]